MSNRININKVRSHCTICMEPMLVTRIRKRQLCRSCRRKAIELNIFQLRHKQGPNYEKWKANLKKSM